MARYEQTASLLGQNQNSTENTNTNKSTNVLSNEVSTTTGSNSSAGSTNSRETSTSDFLDPVARKALNDLIKTLSQGGTEEQRRALEDRLREVATNRDIRNQYSAGNALADAEGAANSALSKALQATLPQIAASVDAAGVSGNSFSGLLTQQAAQQAADMAAELTLQNKVNYGNIQTGLSSVLEQLTRGGQDEVTTALLEALSIAKGASESTVRTGNSKTQQSGSSSQTTNTTGTQEINERATGNSTSATSTGLNATRAPGATVTFSELTTPSSNRTALNQKAAYQPGKTSYSQF